jgi:phosphatidylserine/phosphatidylglycerophosphate/cardiolipin synthase-like enzyme
VSDPLVREIGQVVASLPDGALDALERTFRAGLADSAIIDAVPTDAFRERARSLIAARDAAAAESPAVGLALAAAREREQVARAERVSVVWTGPETSAIPVRKTEQALLELIAGARERLIVVSFAVYKVPEVAAALVACAERGCQVAVVVESEVESGGKVTFEMSQALGSEVAKHATLYTWPRELRPETGNGKRASLHAKCAVADGERLLVSSANLTEYAFTKNMELGLLVEGGDVPSRVQAHLEALISSGVLRITP